MKINGSELIDRVDRGASTRPGKEVRHRRDSHVDNVEDANALGSLKRHHAESAGRPLLEQVRAATGLSAIGGSNNVSTPEQAIELFRYISDEVLPRLGEQDDITRLSAIMLNEEIGHYEEIVARLGQANPETILGLEAHDDAGEIM